jgi:hypothetical protein
MVVLLLTEDESLMPELYEEGALPCLKFLPHFSVNNQFRHLKQYDE